MNQVEIPHCVNSLTRLIKIRSKLPDLYARRNQQAAVTRELSAKLAELFEARPWESAPSPEETRAAKREVAELSDRLEEEREFFQAISIAIQSVQSASSSAIDALNEKIDGVVRAVAADAEEGVLATLDSAVKDTMALYAMRVPTRHDRSECFARVQGASQATGEYGLARACRRARTELAERPAKQRHVSREAKSLHG